jgi:hypothetical protein
MKAPIPCGADAQRLRIQGIIPTSTDDLDPAFDIARKVIPEDLKLALQLKTSGTGNSCSQNVTYSQVRHAHLPFFDRFSLGTAYQLKPPSADNSTRSGHLPPPEYAQPLVRIVPLCITTCLVHGDMIAEDTGI